MHQLFEKMERGNRGRECGTFQAPPAARENANVATGIYVEAALIQRRWPNRQSPFGVSIRAKVLLSRSDIAVLYALRDVLVRPEIPRLVHGKRSRHPPFKIPVLHEVPLGRLVLPRVDGGAHVGIFRTVPRVVHGHRS